MGADSSTLQSIQTLDDTLGSIERRLFNIEDIYLHHERAVVEDSHLLVCGKRIATSGSVNLIVGPILGSFSESFVNVAVEIDQEADISLNVFLASSALMEDRFVSTTVERVQKNQLHVFKITGLFAGLSYIIQVGGVMRDQSVGNIVHFTTPQHCDDCQLFLMHCSRIDSAKAGEINSWDHLAQDSESKEYRSRPSLLIHTGDFVDLTTKLRVPLLDILHFVVSEDLSESRWDDMLYNFQCTTLNCFRQALQTPSVRKVLRCSSSCFVVGEGESMSSFFECVNGEIQGKPVSEILANSKQQVDNSISSRVRLKNIAKDDNSYDPSTFAKSVATETTQQRTTSRVELEEVNSIRSLTLSLLARMIRWVLLYYLQGSF
jgi:hypothetical protein